MPDDRLERITNTLLENISYFTQHLHVNFDDEDIGVTVSTNYRGVWKKETGTGSDVESAKREACRKIATRIIEGTD
jgi:hypothetical protein